MRTAFSSSYKVLILIFTIAKTGEFINYIFFSLYENSPDIYKILKMSIGAMLKLLPDHLKTKNMF